MRVPSGLSDGPTFSPPRSFALPMSSPASAWREAASAATGPDGADLLLAVRAALADDLDSPRALAAVDAWCDAALSGAGDPDSPALMSSTVDALLGVRL